MQEGYEVNPSSLPGRGLCPGVGVDLSSCGRVPVFVECLGPGVMRALRPNLAIGVKETTVTGVPSEPEHARPEGFAAPEEPVEERARQAKAARISEEARARRSAVIMRLRVPDRRSSV
ncbi:MAG: hypothetical protein ACK4WH_10100 [Phycisphaerales bacterium]